ncbi:MAG TPA: FG-GAP and VCBS repeat-containing protein [Polyangiaceae bacterium LLY-WYZ-15_(1-7)]|nr:FG-GAP and VCBS repeat-containing protein [Polyangiaceae bacterium LLY-WYZ-15_(1-7)]HJL08603.1 FG-GAP and VCBS repeat-containing protein [Polyangiaceae bacterium LLY-WYZ-15_(1-7)]HJL25110.1 FG-GAP and VCBS repeat-containing protein [Polyangiaceae bacterium LLY-WYZ-15_(1-7)]HJL39282.1 FG-GAP and VCBS repeat-containing protein [Polyangiaceae bacterium LLY-WYZ-15_(1-7)]
MVLGGALASACLAGGPVDEPGGASAGLDVEPSICGPEDPGFLCEGRLWVHQGDDAMALPYCANGDLDSVNDRGQRNPPLPHTRLIIAQHGRGSDAGAYQSILQSATWQAILADLAEPGETLVVAPQFLQPDYVCSKGIPNEDLEDIFLWSEGGVDHDYSVGGRSSKPGEAFQMSSFELYERLLDKAIARMPDLEEVVFVGQSAGGQLVQRFAALNDYPFGSRVRVRYVPANAFGYLYTTHRRPKVGEDEFVPLLNGIAPAYPDPEVCDALPGELCDEYDDYATGLDAVPGGHAAALMTPLDQVDASYMQREVTYLVGEADIAHWEQCYCHLQVQGEHRRARAEHLSRYMRDVRGAAHHQVVRLPDFAHGNDALKQPCAAAAIFGAPELCDALEDHVVGADIGGTVLDVAFGNVDDDPAQEMAIIEWAGWRTRVRVLDDHGAAYAELYEPSASWGWLDQAQAVAFGDVDGDGRDELAVGRRAFSGDPWLIYRRTGANVWSVVDSGGADWEAPRTAGAVAFGDLDGDGREELGVTRRASSGARWYVYSHVLPGGVLPLHPMELVRSWSWGAPTLPTDLAFGDFDGDGEDELAVSNDGTSGDRVVVYDFAGWLILTRGLGADWGPATVVRQLAAGDLDRLDGEGDELVVGSDFPRWTILDDASNDYETVLDSGFGEGEWSGASATSLALGEIDMQGDYLVLAAVAQGPAGSLLEILTFDGRDGGPVVADYARPDLGGVAELGPVAFGDVEGLGGGEIVLGVANPGEAGYGLRVLPAP